MRPSEKCCNHLTCFCDRTNYEFRFRVLSSDECVFCFFVLYIFLDVFIFGSLGIFDFLILGFLGSGEGGMIDPSGKTYNGIMKVEEE